MALPEVQIELYENGRGPKLVVTEKLQGWDANKLDIETMLNKYRLKALYAFSLETGRGQKLIFNPRNGLSITVYSGMPNVIIRLDSDPKTPIAKIVLRGALLSLLVLSIMGFAVYSPADWAKRMRELGGGQIGWIVGFLIFMMYQLSGWNLRGIR